MKKSFEIKKRVDVRINSFRCKMQARKINNYYFTENFKSVFETIRNKTNILRRVIFTVDDDINK